MPTLPTGEASLRGTDLLARKRQQIWNDWGNRLIDDDEADRRLKELTVTVQPATVIDRVRTKANRPRCPVRRNSQCGPVPKQVKMDWPQRNYIMNSLRQLEQQTRGKTADGGYQGVAGDTGVNIVEALLDLQLSNGDIMWGYKAIALKAGCCERTLGAYLQRLKNLNVIYWINRSKPGVFFPYVQDVNAYYIRPPSEWKGWITPCTIKPPPPRPPLPHPDTTGAHPHMEPLDTFKALQKAGASLADQIEALEADPADRIAVALAKVHRAGNDRRHTLSNSLHKRHTQPKPPP